MKKIILITILTLFSAPLFADEQVQLTDAPKSFIEQAIHVCKSYAEEDGIQEANLNAYLLQCVNDELELSDYKKIKSLPKV